MSDGPTTASDPDLENASAPITRDQLEAAEVRLRRLLDTRDRHNQEARELRGKRDELNMARARLLETMGSKRQTRDILNGEVQTWKAKRNEARDKARALLELKAQLRAQMATDSLGRVRDMERELARLEHDYKARPMAPEKEREHVEKMRRHKAEMDKLLVVAAEVEKLGVKVKEMDGEISRLFTEADAAHAQMSKANEDAQVLHAELGPTFEQLNILRGESDRYHRDAVAANTKANEYHEKAQTLRDQVMTVRGEDRKARAEERAAVKQMVEEGRAKLQPTDDFYEAALQELKKGGKLSL